ncbi:MAG: DNA-binding protein WhiA [Oscillospiraceae bacterium]|nr:DNA-binding protein WhiA [Oscillospiraceae bacterium]
MSFSGNVKSELCRTEVEKNCCALAEAMGTLLFANTFSADCIRIVTENRDFGMRLPRLFRKGLGVTFDQLPETDAVGKLTYAVNDTEKIQTVFSACGFSAQTSISLHVNFALLEKECCRRAFLRGAFLAGGSVTDPEKRYHLELSTSHLKVSRETGTLMREMELTAKETERKGSSVLYYKQSDSIEDFLTAIGAPVSAMAVMSAKIEKDWRNAANRKTNCDAANVEKAVAASQEQLAAIRKLEKSSAYESLPEKLRQTAILRREYPEMTLSELAQLHEPPISKSAVNHRMRKLLSMASEI